MGGVKMEQKLKWVHASGVWRAEVKDSNNPDSLPWGARGAIYEIRKLGSPAFFELRWLWHPGFGWARDQREALGREYMQRNWGSGMFPVSEAILF